MKKTQKGFALLEALLILVVVGVLGAVGWYALHTKHQTDQILSQADKISQDTPVKLSSIKTFEDCKKAAGSKIQESYPEVCVTKDGKRFAQPSSASSKPTVVISSDNKVQITLPTGWKVGSHTTDSPTCLLAKATNCTDEFYLTNNSSSGYVMIFASNQSSSDWYFSVFGGCNSEENSSLGGHAEFICHGIYGYTYTVSNGQLLVYFRGDPAGNDASSGFTSIVSSLKFL